MQVPGRDNAGPGSDFLGPVPELISEGKDYLFKRKRKQPA